MVFLPHRLVVQGPTDLNAIDFLTAKKHMLDQLKVNLAQASARMKKYAYLIRVKRIYNFLLFHTCFISNATYVYYILYQFMDLLD